MKILIISDSHGSFSGIRKVLSRESDAEMLIHCGDIEGDEGLLARSFAGKEVKIVAGNNDIFCNLDPELTFTLYGRKFFVTHGHRYGISMTPEILLDEAMSRDADIVLYGHTHRPAIIYHQHVTGVNPGSLTFPRQEGRIPSYAVMEIDETGRFDVEIRYL